MSHESSVGKQDEKKLYGPFHRVQSPTQSNTTANEQKKSGEIWGRPRQYSDIPQVQAYVGSLEEGREGIEFMTSAAPDRGTAPGHARWTGPRNGVTLEDGFAKIQAVVHKNTQNVDASN